MSKRIIYEPCYLAGAICENINNFCLKILLCESGKESELNYLAQELRRETREEWSQQPTAKAGA